MSEPDLSPLEKAIAKKIDQTKGKASQPGYLRELITKLHLRIEAALSRGCEYNDLAKSITEGGVKISAATLKQYHTEHRRKLEKEIGTGTHVTDSILPPFESSKVRKPQTTTAQLGSKTTPAQPDSKQAAIDKLSAKR